MSEVTNTSRSHATGRNLAITGALMQSGPLFGLAGTVIGMRRAFDALEAASPGIKDPGGLSAAIGHVLVSTAAGLGVALVGVVLMCIAALVTPYRAKWFFWLLILSAPVGLFPLAIALIKRHEFFPTELSHPTSPS